MATRRTKRTKPQQAASARSLDRWQVKIRTILKGARFRSAGQLGQSNAETWMVEQLEALLKSMQRAEVR